MYKWCVALLMLVVTGCASATTGTTQKMNVVTRPYHCVPCSLKNEQGAWSVPCTPAEIEIERSYSDLAVRCGNDRIYGTANVRSSTHGMTFGNALIGGGIGAAVDMGTGAAYQYPREVTIPMAEGGHHVEVNPAPSKEDKKTISNSPH